MRVRFIEHPIEITRGGQIQQHHSAVLFGLADNPSFKGGVRFDAYPKRAASEVCADYLTLFGRFVADFIRDHAHLITT